MRLMLAVAMGGALGAVARYLAASAITLWAGEGFPYGTLAVNVLGSTLMGVFVEAGALFWSPSPELRALVAVGVLGSFTTFSAFSLEVAALGEAGQIMLAGLYIGLSVALCLAGFRFGERLVRGAYRRVAR